MKYTSIFFIIVLCFEPVFSQKTIKVKNCKASCIVANITPEQAEEKAVLIAKQEALRQAGVSEKIGVNEVSTVSETDMTVSDYFSRFVNVEMYGEVIDYEVYKMHKRIDQHNQFVIDVEINAEVIKYKDLYDPEFQISVRDISTVYKNGDYLSFQVTPHKNGYLKIFWFDNDKNCEAFFPNKFEPNNALNKGRAYQFPSTEAVDYEISIAKEQEENTLVFLYTKQDIPITEVLTMDKLFQWIYKISPSKRVVKTFPFVVYKK